MATAEILDIEAIDLHDPAVFADGPPNELFARMREQAPVHRNSPSGDQDGFWSLTGYQDIVAVNKDWESFSSERRGSFLVEGGIVPKDFQKLLFNMMDPPGHDRHRGILQKVFTARAVADREPDIRATVNRLIDNEIEAGECDFVTDIAVELPLTVTANMLGVPHEDRAQLFRWTNQLADTSVAFEEKMQTLGEIAGYLVAFITALRAHPTDVAEAEVPPGTERHVLRACASNVKTVGLDVLRRLELTICFQESLRRLPALELAGPVVKKPNNSFHWMVAMPVRFPAGGREGTDA
jgi:cytochrome P450